MARYYIGSYDGSTWSTMEKNLTAASEDPINADADRFGIVASKDTLLLISSDGADAGNRLFAAPGTDLTGTYVELDTGITVRTLEKSDGANNAGSLVAV